MLWGDGEWDLLLYFCEVPGGLGQLGLDVLLSMHLCLHLQLEVQQVLLALLLRTQRLPLFPLQEGGVHISALKKMSQPLCSKIQSHYSWIGEDR